MKSNNTEHDKYGSVVSNKKKKRTRTVVLDDVEFLDKIKEMYGSSCAESIFNIIGDIISDEFRNYQNESIELFNRMGKNEFLVVFENISEKKIKEKLEEIKELIEEIYVKYKNRKIEACILSYGYHYIDLDSLKKNSLDEELVKNGNARKRVRPIDKEK